MSTSQNMSHLLNKFSFSLKPNKKKKNLYAADTKEQYKLSKFPNNYNIKKLPNLLKIPLKTVENYAYQQNPFIK